MGRQSPNAKQKRKKAMDVTPSKMIEQRESAIEQMNQPLKRKFNQIEKQVNDLRAENLRYYYKIGKICKEIDGDATKYLGHNGLPGLRLIEQALSTQARTLRKSAAFAKMYDEEALEILISMKNDATGYQLHWGHVSYLLTLASQEEREKYAREATDKMWDPGALHDAIKKREERAVGHGRKHAIPKTLAAQVRQMLTLSQQWNRKNDSIWNGDGEEEDTNNIFTNVLNTPPDDLDQDLIDDLAEVRTLMFLIGEATTANGDMLDRVIEHGNAVLQQRQAAEETQAEKGSKEPRQIDLDSKKPSSKKRRGKAAAVST